MGKKKKKTKKQTEKELLEQQLHKYQKGECLVKHHLGCHLYHFCDSNSNS